MRDEKKRKNANKPVLVWREGLREGDAARAGQRVAARECGSKRAH